MKKLYLGCALKLAPKEFVDGIIAVREKLESNFEILRFVDLNQRRPTDQEIFQHDMEQIWSSDGVIAICDEPSFGLGFEVATALMFGKPVLMVAQEGRTISAFPMGIDRPGATFKRYQDFNDLLAIITAHFPSE